jgi:hypothetical protein
LPRKYVQRLVEWSLCAGQSRLSLALWSSSRIPSARTQRPSHCTLQGLPDGNPGVMSQRQGLWVRVTWAFISGVLNLMGGGGLSWISCSMFESIIGFSLPVCITITVTDV